MTRLDSTRGLGGDPVAMRRAAHEFDDQAIRIREFEVAMSGKVRQMWWKGPDAERFQTVWDENQCLGNQRIIRELQHLAECLRQEAAKQERASRA